MAAYRLSYEWTGRDRGFDLRHLVYANGADWFITNDGGLRELANQIFSSNPRVLSQDDFLKRAGVANSTPIERGSIVQYTRS